MQIILIVPTSAKGWSWAMRSALLSPTMPRPVRMASFTPRSFKKAIYAALAPRADGAGSTAANASGRPVTTMPFAIWRTSPTRRVQLVL